MSVELLQRFSIAGYVAGGIFLGVSILLFFVLHIPKVIGDLSGTTARKAIASIEQQSGGEYTAHRARRIRSGRDDFSTEKFMTSKLQETSQDTTVLMSETTVLAEQTGTDMAAVTVDVDFGFCESKETID